MHAAPDFKELRESLNLQQVDICKQLNVTAGFVSIYEAAVRRPRPPLVKRFAQAMSNALKTYGSDRAVTFDEVAAAFAETQRRADLASVPGAAHDGSLAQGDR